jgi:hypothetical protein
MDGKIPADIIADFHQSKYVYPMMEKMNHFLIQINVVPELMAYPLQRVMELGSLNVLVKSHVRENAIRILLLMVQRLLRVFVFLILVVRVLRVAVEKLAIEPLVFLCLLQAEAFQKTLQYHIISIYAKVHTAARRTLSAIILTDMTIKASELKNMEQQACSYAIQQKIVLDKELI